jgi:ribosomal protein L44E
MTKRAAKKIGRKIGSLNRRAFISVESFGRQISRGFESPAMKVCLTTACSSCVFQDWDD